MVKNLPAMWETRFNPWVGKIPWRREWLLTQVFLPGKFHRQSRLAGYSPGIAESDTTEWSSHHMFAITTSKPVILQGMYLIKMNSWKNVLWLMHTTNTAGKVYHFKCRAYNLKIWVVLRQHSINSALNIYKDYGTQNGHQVYIIFNRYRETFSLEPGWSTRFYSQLLEGWFAYVNFSCFSLFIHII